MDVKITDDRYSLEKLVEDLNAVSTPDICFVKAAESVMHTKEIAFAEFKLSFDSIDAEKVNEFFFKESIICQKKTKKGGIKDIDIAPLIKKAELSGNELTLILTAGNENNLNPSLVMTAFYDFCGTKPDFYDVTRTMIYDKDLNQFV
jgi:radical SAM-linked protein